MVRSSDHALKAKEIEEARLQQRVLRAEQELDQWKNRAPARKPRASEKKQHANSGTASCPVSARGAAPERAKLPAIQSPGKSKTDRAVAKSS